MRINIFIKMVIILLFIIILILILKYFNSIWKNKKQIFSLGCLCFFNFKNDIFDNFSDENINKNIKSQNNIINSVQKPTYSNSNTFYNVENHKTYKTQNIIYNNNVPPIPDLQSRKYLEEEYNSNKNKYNKNKYEDVSLKNLKNFSSNPASSLSPITPPTIILTSERLAELDRLRQLEELLKGSSLFFIKNLSFKEKKIFSYFKILIINSINRISNKIEFDKVYLKLLVYNLMSIIINKIKSIFKVIIKITMKIFIIILFIYIKNLFLISNINLYWNDSFVDYISIINNITITNFTVSLQNIINLFVEYLKDFQSWLNSVENDFQIENNIKSEKFNIDNPTNKEEILNDVNLNNKIENNNITFYKDIRFWLIFTSLILISVYFYQPDYSTSLYNKILNEQEIMHNNNWFDNYLKYQKDFQFNPKFNPFSRDFVRLIRSNNLLLEQRQNLIDTLDKLLS